MSLNEVLYEYHSIRQLSALISQAYGGIFTYFLASFIITHSRHFAEYLFGHDISARIFLTFYVALSTAIFILSAEVVVNVSRQCTLCFHEYFN